MSTCSTATGAARAGRRRHGSCDHAGRGGGDGLEGRWRELEKEWDAYKTSRCSGASRRRHHRRSRSGSGTGTPSSAVIVASEPADAPGSHLLLGVRLGGSPRRLVSSLQRDGSSTASAGVTPERGRYDGDDHHDAASSVSSVDAGTAAASSNSSCSSAATSLFSLRDDELAVAGEAAKTGGTATPATGSIGRFVAAIAVAGVVLLVAAIMAAAVLEFAMDDGQAEFLVPT